VPQGWGFFFSKRKLHEGIAMLDWKKYKNLQVFKNLYLKFGAKILVEGRDKRTTEVDLTELGAINVTPGTVTASKALVVDSSGNLSTGVVGFTGAVLETLAGAGITGGTGTVYKTSVEKVGGRIATRITLDLTGLGSSTTDLDIIGVGASAAHLGQVTAARNGTVLYGTMTCLEVPAGGADDIDLYSATEATGVFDAGIATLTETALVTAAGAWTLGLTKVFTADLAAAQYLYLVGGEAGTAGTYTAGKFQIVLEGY
jgi:hypothetical protein